MSVFVFPDYSDPPPPGVASTKDCVVFCVRFESFALGAASVAGLQKAHDEFSIRPQVMFAILANPQADSVRAWQKLNKLLTFRTVVVVEFVTAARYDLLTDNDVRVLREKFFAFKSSALDLDRALVQKECLWAQENASDHLTTSRDLINAELQHPTAQSKFFVAGNAFPSSSGGGADAKLSVYLDTAFSGPILGALVLPDFVASIAARSQLAVVSSAALAEFVVFLVDEKSISEIVSSPTAFYVILLPSTFSYAEIWQIREDLDKRRVAYDIVSLVQLGDESDLHAAIDCGFRNAKQSLLASKISRMDAAITAEEVTQDEIDESINHALRTIRAMKRA